MMESRFRQLEHFVSKEPFDPFSVEKLTPEQEQFYLASQWKLMWWKLKRHKLALFSGLILLVLYFSVAFAEILAPYNLETRDAKHIYAPPQMPHLFHEGEFVGPFVYGYKFTLNMTNLKREYTADPKKIQKLRFFCSADKYNFWGLVESSFHIVCPAKGGTAYFVGTDRLGRDLLSRTFYGARISLTIGLVGIIISFTLGIVIGGIAGYYGGIVDNLIQRLIEILRSFPELPLWMALSAILPVTWSPLLVFLGITVILALLDWTGLARAVRSKLLSLREEDYCTAAVMMGAKPKRIIFRHLLPGFFEPSDSIGIPIYSRNDTG